MSDTGKKTIELRGPWMGIHEETPDPSYVEESWNVEFSEQYVRSAKTPLSLLGSPTFVPALAVKYDGSTFTDITTSGAMGSATTLYLGFTQRPQTISCTNNAFASVHTFYRNDAGALVDLGAASAATVIPSSITGNDMYRGADLFSLLLDPTLFYLKFTTVTTGTYPASSFRAVFRGGGGNGLFEYVKRSGYATGLVGMDSRTPLGSNGPPAAALFEWRPGRQYLIPLKLPVSALSSSLDAAWSFIYWDDFVLATNGEGAVVQWDGTTCQRLAAVNGNDSAVRTYLPSVPMGKYMAVYHNRLYIGGGRYNPRTTYISEYDNNTSAIPTDGSAPVGGPNLWPTSDVEDHAFDVADRIQGYLVKNDRLYVFTEGAVYSWDDTSLQCVEPHVGCVAPQSIADLGPFGIAYLGRSAVYVFDGLRSQPISGPIKRYLGDYLNWNCAWRAVGITYAARHQYRLFVTDTSIGTLSIEPENQVCLVFDYTRKTWAKLGKISGGYTGYMAVSAAAFRSLGETEAIVTVDPTGAIFAQDVLRGNSAIPPFIAFAKLGGTLDVPALWRDAWLEIVANGTQLAVSGCMDGASPKTTPTTVTVTASLAGQGITWPDGSAANARPTPFRAPMGKIGRRLQLKIIGDGNALELRAVTLEVEPR